MHQHTLLCLHLHVNFRLSHMSQGIPAANILTMHNSNLTSVLVFEKDFVSTAPSLCVASSLCVRGVMLNTCSAHCTHIDNIISTRHHSAARNERVGAREKPRREAKTEKEKRAFVAVLHLNDHRLGEHESYVIPRVTALILRPLSLFFLSSVSSSSLLVFIMSSS